MTSESSFARPDTGFVIVFKFSAAFALLATAAAKLISATGTQAVLNTFDPLLGMRMRPLLIILGLLEAGISLFVLFGRPQWLSFMLVSMLGGQFLLCRTMFLRGNYSRGCPCLGTIAQRLPFSQQTVDGALWVLAAYLCVGGLFACYLSMGLGKTKGPVLPV